MPPPAHVHTFKTVQDAAMHLGLSDAELKLVKKFIDSHMPDELTSGTQNWHGVEGNKTALRWAEHFIAMPLPVAIPEQTYDKTKYAVKKIFQEVHYNFGRRAKSMVRVERTAPSISTLPSSSHSVPPPSPRPQGASSTALRLHAPSRSMASSSLSLKDKVRFVIEDEVSSRIATIFMHDIAPVTYDWREDVLPNDSFEKFISVLDEEGIAYNEKEDVVRVVNSSCVTYQGPVEISIGRHMWNAVEANDGVGHIWLKIMRKGSSVEQRVDVVHQLNPSRKRQPEDNNNDENSRKRSCASLRWPPSSPARTLTDIPNEAGTPIDTTIPPIVTEPEAKICDMDEEQPDSVSESKSESGYTDAEEEQQAQEVQARVGRLYNAKLTNRALDWIVSNKDSHQKTRFLSFWNLLDSQTKKRKCGFVIPGMTVELYVHQLIAIFWALERSSTTGGGFIADCMKMGKTLVVLGFMQIDYLVQRNIKEVLKSREDQDGKHLGDMEKALVTGVESHSRCPSMSMASDWRYPFRCACEPQSPTMEFRHDLRGPSLLIASPRQLPAWTRKWRNAFVDSSNAVRLWNGWASALDHCTEGTKEVLLGTDYAVDSSALEPNLQLVLTTWNSYDNHVVGKTKCQVKQWRKVNRKKDLQPIWVDQTTQPQWTNVFRDECHEEHSTSRTMNTLGRVTSDYRFFCLSGTVFWRDFSSVAPLWCFWSDATKGWLVRHRTESKEAKKLYRFRGDWLMNAGRQWRRLNEMQESDMLPEDQKERSSLTAQIKDWMYLLMIARKPTSHWNGTKFLKVPPHNDIPILVELDEQELEIEATSLGEYKNEVVTLLRERMGVEPSYDDIREELKSHNSRYIKQRILVSWPALAKIVKANEQKEGRSLKLTQAEWLENGRSLDSPLPYLDNLEAIFHKNKKLMVLDEIIEDIDEKGPDPATNEPSKILVVCARDLSTRLLALYLEKKHKASVLLYDSTEPLKKRSQMVVDFQQDTLLQKAEDYEKLNPKPARFLVGTMECLNSGLDLYKAGDLILWEPGENKEMVDQVRMRISRQGQRREKTFMWCMRTNATVDHNAMKPKHMDDYVTRMAVDAES